MTRFSNKKPLEKKAIKKKALQTKNVKKLMTSDDAYSPEKRMIKVFKKTPKGGTGMVKMTTDFSNLKNEAKKAEKKFTEAVGKPTSVQILGPKDFESDLRQRGMRKGGRVCKMAKKGKGKAYGRNS
tara:strand:- start:37 stop:414 length:378 start_codon:yes stop_codon:yes gene_type:complete